MIRFILSRPLARVAAATALVIVATSQAAAQAPPEPLTPGTRVRVQVPGAQKSGTVQEFRGDSLVLLGSDALTASVARHDINRLWVSEGRRSAGQGAWRGIGLGLLLGGVAGMALGVADGDDEPGLLALSAEEKAMVGGIALGGVGAIIGGIAGAMNPGERWTRVDRRTLALSARPRGGVALSIAHAF